MKLEGRFQFVYLFVCLLFEMPKDNFTEDKFKT